MSGDIERSSIARADMRASDDDRNAVAQRLQGAVEEGRLGLSDYDERLQQVYAAKTYAELDRVTADLPDPVASQPVVAREQSVVQRSEYWDRWRSWLGLAIVLTTIWAISSVSSNDLQGYWPGVPLGIWAAILLASAVNGKSGDGKSCGGKSAPTD
ncbi:MAG: DUF1707 domain-containing protein [Pseudonocardia sp.]|nr:DUF1707 domain-containing protein [Pseudonocardia sp.]